MYGTVPYVYEKPPVKVLKDFVGDIKKMIQSDKKEKKDRKDKKNKAAGKDDKGKSERCSTLLGAPHSHIPDEKVADKSKL